MPYYSSHCSKEKAEINVYLTPNVLGGWPTTYYFHITSWWMKEKNILKTTVSLDTTRLSACVECTKAPADRDGCAKNKQPGLTEWGA